jgi:hypothetical protein
VAQTAHRPSQHRWRNGPDVDRGGIDAVRAYEAKYGALADQPISEWDADFPRVGIDRVEFEQIWTRARSYLDQTV